MVPHRPLPQRYEAGRQFIANLCGKLGLEPATVSIAGAGRDRMAVTLRSLCSDVAGSATCAVYLDFTVGDCDENAELMRDFPSLFFFNPATEEEGEEAGECVGRGANWCRRALLLLSGGGEEGERSQLVKGDRVAFSVEIAAPLADAAVTVGRA